jgi:surfactin synthase thioesterase subunit
VNPPGENWLRRYLPRPDADIQLVCFPHAGGAASFYRNWPALLPARIELVAVQYPGREDRFGEPFVTDLHRLADQLADAITGTADRPIALFGHSMGGALAHEVSIRLHDRAMPPVQLIVSGKEPPQYRKDGDVHRRDDDGLQAELLRLSDANRQLVDDTELWGLIKPVIRNDYQLIEAYRPRTGPMLDCPLTAFVGQADPELTQAEAADWAEHTTGPFRLQTFPGGHFYLTAHRTTVVDAVSATVSGRPSRDGNSPIARAIPAAWPSTP